MKYLLIVLFLFCISCHRQHEAVRILDHAESLMREQPSEALHMLKTIRAEKLSRASTRAKYALLYTQALDKNHIFSTDDSLIRIAVRYYDRKGTPYEKASALYYLGRIHANQNDCISAAEAFFAAEAFTQETGDLYLRGLLDCGIGYLYYNQYSFEDALKRFENSEKLFRRVGGMPRNIAVAIELQGYAHHNLENFSCADSLYREALTLYEDINSKNDIFRVKLQQSWIINGQANTDSIRSYLDRLYAEYAPEKSPRENWGLMLSLYFRDHNIDSARAYGLKCINAIDYNSGYAIADCYGILEHIEFMDGNYQKAHDYASQYCKLVDSMHAVKCRNFMKEIEQRSKNKILLASKEKIERKNHYLTIIFLLITFIFIAGCILGLWWFQKWQRKAQKKIRQAKAELHSLQINYSDMREQLVQLKERSDKEDTQEVKLFNALEERLIGLRDLIATSQTIKPSVFIKNFQKYANVNVNSRYALSDLQFVVNRKFHGVVDYLKANYPDLTKHDLDLCCLLCFGFTQQAICFMYDYGDIGSFYNKRSRLRHKLHLTADYKTEDFFRDLLKQLNSQAE